MTSTPLRSVVTDLNTALAGFEMEISDTVFDSLLSSITACIKETDEASDIGLVLTAMDAVVRYVDSLRSQADPIACGLVEEIGLVYMQLCSESMNDTESRKMTAAIISKVIQWQKRCLLAQADNAQSQSQTDKPVLSGAVLSLINENITQTNDLVRQEMESIKSSVGTLSLQKSFQNTVLDKKITTTVEEQVNTMQNLLREELSKLRKDLTPKSTQV